MQRLENRKRMITYCDRCKKELKGSFTIIRFPDGSELHFCSTYTSRINKTCYDKYNEEEFNKAIKKQENKTK